MYLRRNIRDEKSALGLRTSIGLLQLSKLFSLKDFVENTKKQNKKKNTKVAQNLRTRRKSSISIQIESIKTFE